MKTFRVNTPEEIKNCEVCGATIKVGDLVFRESMYIYSIETCSVQCIYNDTGMQAMKEWFADIAKKKTAERLKLSA